MRNIRLIISALIIIMILLPFTSRMLNYDDFIYIQLTQELEENGFDTFNQQYDFLGYRVTMQDGTHTAMIGYFYMLLMRITGNSYALMHLILYIFFAFSVIPLYMLLNHYEQKHILLKIVLLLTMPVLTVNVNSFMSDIPAFITFLWGLALYLSMKGKKRYIGILFLIVSALFSYIYIVFPLLLYLCERDERNIKPLIISVSAVILVFSVFILLNLSPTPLNAMSWKGSETLFNYHNLGNRFISYVMMIGFISLFILAIRSTYRQPMFYVTMFLGFAFGFTLPGFSMLASLIASLLIGTGIFALYLLFLREIKYRNLFLWFSIFSIAAIIFFPMMIPRYMLIMLLPAVIILLSEYKGKELVIGIVVNIILSILFLHSDMTFTNSVYSSIPEQKGEVYFTGEWAFREYMENMGAEMLLRDDSILKQNAHVFLPQGMASWNPHINVMKNLHYVQSHAVTLPFLSLFSVMGKCGFYTDEYGPLPFNIVPYDTLYISEFVFDTLSRPIFEENTVLWRNGPVLPVDVPCTLNLETRNAVDLIIRFFPSKEVFSQSEGIIVAVQTDSNSIADTILPSNKYILELPESELLRICIYPKGNNKFNWIGIYAEEKD